jgi:hypothetical protein
MTKFNYAQASCRTIPSDDHSFLQKSIGTAIVVVAATVLLSACTTNRPEATAPGAPNNVTTEEVAENHLQLIGKTVTVRSEPIQKVGTNSFTIEDEQFFGSEPILVINASGNPLVLPAEQDVEVQVTGEVRNVVVTDLERDYNLDLQPDLYRDYENKPAIIAQSIALAPKPGQITENPQQYYGKTIAVTGEIGNIRGANSFTLDEDQLFGASDLLVINTTPQATIREGEKVAVTGVLRPFVLAEIERDYGITWDQGVIRELEVEYRDKPVLVTKEIYPSAIPEVAK